MRQLMPAELKLTDLGAHLGDDRHPERADRPWIMANMVTSVDGAIAIDDRSGGLGGEPDRLMFSAIRSLPDVILVGAGTARTERYRRPPVGESSHHRLARGQTPAPRLAIVTNSGVFPDDQPFLSGAGEPPIVFHSEGSQLNKQHPELEWCAAGDQQVDLGLVIRELHDRGARSVLCEGGPTLLGNLHEADLIDELFITISPQLVGGVNQSLLGSSQSVTRNVELHRLITDEGVLFCTYRRPT